MPATPSRALFSIAASAAATASDLSSPAMSTATNITTSSISRKEEDRSRRWTLSTCEWQAWGTSSPVPAMVAKVVRDMKSLEKEAEVTAKFGGLGGKLQGDFRLCADKKHRAVYESLADTEKKLQFFSARQIACRVLGSSGYLCQKCWLAMEDCMCSRLNPCTLWPAIRFWVYMHPKDFLRQNNTGKLLWQIFGIHAAIMCLYGIREQEEIMWDAFRQAGKNMVWFLYPNKSTTSVKSILDAFFREAVGIGSQALGLAEETLNFVLIDGTWNNSAALYSRLKDTWATVWGEEDLPCISLSSLGTSAMHKLRPQPAWDRTCTAAAAAGLLSELHERSELNSFGLDGQAEVLEQALDVLLDALTARRTRMGRSVTRREKKSTSYKLIHP